LTSTTWWSQTQLALRRIFEIDPDFQERMFARQIAVMKGQAWNVVETLKTPDHGPLELTRRAKVCVWDDLVDVPIAVPLRRTSSDTRRLRSHSDKAKGIEEEMDIGSSSTHQEQADLLGAPSPPADLPNPGRFEIAESPIEEGDSVEDEAGRASTASPGRPRPSMAASYHGPRRSLNMYSPHRERRYSFATTAGRRNSNSIAQQLYGHSASAEYYDDDELDGDLGYAAAEGMEGNQRKVIVERLEPVKSKNPVFTWC
jgi:phosphatidylinositol 4-kinase type 2